MARSRKKPCLAGLGDRVLIAVMTYTFCRVGAFVAMRVEDYFANAAQAREMVGALGIRPTDPMLSCRSLSGGNMQKMVLGKCLLPGPKVLLLNTRTRGVDVSAHEDIYCIIRELVDAGTSVLLPSEDLPELGNERPSRGAAPRRDNLCLRRR
jgi:ABC-type sugar transport system ATPase subunit